jgi:hypothetical protein
MKNLTEVEIQEIDREIAELRAEIDRIDNGTPPRDLEVRRLGDQIEELLAKKGEPWELKKMIRKGNKLKHKKRSITGTATKDEDNGSVLVQQNDGTITVWAASDAEVIT